MEEEKDGRVWCQFGCPADCMNVFWTCFENGYYLLKCRSRELFLSNASLFVHDAEAYDNYQRQLDETEQNVSFS